jgi:hypothetical protein
MFLGGSLFRSQSSDGNIKVDPREIDYKGERSIGKAEDCVQWQAVVLNLSFLSLESLFV